MKDITSQKAFEKTYQLPYLLGVFLGLNAVSDACLMVDGANCVMVKADLIAGNHDLFSTLLSESGRHRIICTMWTPVNPPKNPEKKLGAMLNSVAGSGQFGAVLLTGLPYCWLAGMDYDGVARAVSSKAPVAAIPAKSMDSDWLEGYDLTLEALARAIPEKKPGKRANNKVALVGYMFDRNESDHAANLKELTRLLKISGLDVVSIWPSGGTVAELARVAEASLIVSLPYGRKAAKTLAHKYGCKLLETGLPMGLKGTSSWLASVRRAAGLPGGLPREVLQEEREAARTIAPALRALASQKADVRRRPLPLLRFCLFCFGAVRDPAPGFPGFFQAPAWRRCGGRNRSLRAVRRGRQSRQDGAFTLSSPEPRHSKFFRAYRGLRGRAPFRGAWISVLRPPLPSGRAVFRVQRRPVPGLAHAELSADKEQGQLFGS